VPLEKMANDSTKDPTATRYDGEPPVYNHDPVQVASLGTYVGIISQAAVAQVQPQSKVYYYITDHLGTPMKMTNESGAVVWSADYRPFGELAISNGTAANNFRFPGQYHDLETGLHYNYQRYYQAKAGRYVTPDPIGQVGGITLFLYSQGNPIMWADPFGLASYRVYWSLESVGVAGMGAGKIEGLVISMHKNKEGLYDAVEFEGLLGGVSVGLPIGATFLNTEVFEDPCEEADVRRVQGLSWLLSGSAAFHKDGVSGGAYRFGGLTGTDENVSRTEGFDFSVDYLGGYVWTKGPVRHLQRPELR